MRILLALPLAFSFACAGVSSSTAGTGSASSQSCGSLVSAVVYRGTDVYSTPDSSSPPIATLKEDTPVCASQDTRGFGFRRIQLANGNSGYVSESSLSI